MESNLEKAKRLLKANAAIQGIELSEDGFIFEMLKLAATPDIFKDRLIRSIEAAKPNMDKITDVDKFIDEVKGE